MSGDGRVEKLFEAALRRLVRRERSLSEMRDFLEARQEAQEASTEDVDGVLRKLVALRYLDDDRLAEAVIRDSRLQSRGPRAAWMKLRRRGVEGWNLERVEKVWRLSGAIDPGEEGEGATVADEIETARRWVERRYSNLRAPDCSGLSREERAEALSEFRKEKQRALGALIRRGYSVSVAKRVIDQLGSD